MQNIMKSDNHSNISIHKGLFNTVNFWTDNRRLFPQYLENYCKMKTVSV